MKSYSWNDGLAGLVPLPLDKGMGEAVARRTVLRKSCPGCQRYSWASQQSCVYCKADLTSARSETWSEVASRVALGNALLHPTGRADLLGLEKHIASGLLLMSGRHLQHGDATQPSRCMEVFTNCSTAATSAMKFYLLLNGSGVGRCYDDDLMVVDWRFAPKVISVLSEEHADYDLDLCGYEDANFAEQFKATAPGETVELKDMHGRLTGELYHRVGDSREGWGMVVELIEVLTWQRRTNQVVWLDFSGVRRRNSLIGGMQGRPSAGPVPTIRAIQNCMKIAKKAQQSPLEWPAWKQNLYVDHYLADCVHLGGARRAARIAVKHWREPGILEFITIKHSEELWTANNSVGLDEEFYEELRAGGAWAVKVASAMTRASYFGNAAGRVKGEPGGVNLHRLHSDRAGVQEAVRAGLGSPFYQPSQGAQDLYRALGEIALARRFWIIVNPCGETPMSLLGAFCVIADLAPFNAPALQEHMKSGSKGPASESDFWVIQEQIEEAARYAVRALIRVNLMPSVFKEEVRRTNRIGISLTGLHEYAWACFGLGFRDLLNPEKSRLFWHSLRLLKEDIRDEAIRYSALLGVAPPHTDTLIKPAGTTSKLFGLTEGAHLPSMLAYLRNLQMQLDDPLVLDYERKGYPVKRGVKGYEHQAIVGFPTMPMITRLGMGPALVTASQATMEEQYRWVGLLEENWLSEHGGQISYTLKYNPAELDYYAFHETFWRCQETVRCCTVMPQEDTSSYPYLPEEPISVEDFAALVASIDDPDLIQAVDLESLQCASGACPI